MLFKRSSISILKCYVCWQKKAAELVGSEAHSNSTNPSLDPLSVLLGPDNPGHLRAMGRNIGKTKLACFQVKKQFMAEMEDKQYHLLHKVNQLESELAKIRRQVSDNKHIYILKVSIWFLICFNVSART